MPMNCQIVRNGDIPALPGETVGELADAAAAFAGALGVRHFSYLMLRPPHGGRSDDSRTLRASYPDEWVARYAARAYAQHDPVIEVTRRARLPFRWGHGPFLRKFGKVRRQVFHEAREFGVTEGYAVPLHGPDGELAVFSICAADGATVDDVVAGAAGDVQLFAVRFHDEMLRRCALRRVPEGPDLTSREAEALVWTADGLTTEETAERLRLSVSAVNYHLRKASRKLGASNKHNAAILAMRQGLI